jgi:Na+-transporting NADH:ubiquinone oxidoreductase subunit B
VLRHLLELSSRAFEDGRPLHRFRAVHEMVDTFLYTPGTVTEGRVHLRDAIDLKRAMTVVVLALLPCIGMGLYNTGYQAHRVVAAGGAPAEAWQSSAMEWLGLAFDPDSILACTVHGALWYLPILVVTFAVGGGWELLFAVVRRKDLNEGFLVTGMLFPLILPPTTPLWQVALGVSFGVVVGKEVFGGTGMNIVNPALAGRVFLYFAYPAEMSGDRPWIPALLPTDGLSGATRLATAAESGMTSLSATSWWDAFVGLVPGSLGETSALACLAGAALLLVTRIGSWRIMLGMTVGGAATTLLLNAVGSETNPLFGVPYHWHVVLGGWAFGLVFMATDPVSAAQTRLGHHVYGFLIGVLTILIRCLNPAYPEGVMLAILLMNVFAPLVDHFTVRRWKARRRRRYAKTLEPAVEASR